MRSKVGQILYKITLVACGRTKYVCEIFICLYLIFIIGPLCIFSFQIYSFLVLVLASPGPCIIASVIEVIDQK